MKEYCWLLAAALGAQAACSQKDATDHGPTHNAPEPPSGTDEQPPPQKQPVLVNGEFWHDTNGNLIQAHGGGLLKHGEYYYWFGEDKRSGWPTQAIACYRSTDLTTWEFRNMVIDAQTDPLIAQSNVERPKVIYNEASNTFVMWLHRESDTNYDLAEAAVAISDSVDGRYRWLKTFRPKQNMSRDCTLFKDDNGKAYFISAANHNKDLHVYRLTADYQNIDAHVSTLFAGKSREAPAVCKKDGLYYLFTSGCTGWEPNQTMVATANSMEAQPAEWSQLKPIGHDTTFNAQGAFIFSLQEQSSTTYIFMLDRWTQEGLGQSKYIWLPLKLEGGKASLDFAHVICRHAASNALHFQTTPLLDGAPVRLASVESNKFLSVNGNGEAVQTDDVINHWTTWQLQAGAEGALKIFSRTAEKVLGRRASDNRLVLVEDTHDTSVMWRVEPVDPFGFDYRITHVATGERLDLYNESHGHGAVVGLWKSNNGKNQRWYLVPVDGGCEQD